MRSSSAFAVLVGALSVITRPVVLGQVPMMNPDDPCSACANCGPCAHDGNCFTNCAPDGVCNTECVPCEVCYDDPTADGCDQCDGCMPCTLCEFCSSCTSCEACDVCGISDVGDDGVGTQAASVRTKEGEETTTFEVGLVMLAFGGVAMLALSNERVRETVRSQLFTPRATHLSYNPVDSTEGTATAKGAGYGSIVDTTRVPSMNSANIDSASNL